MKVESTEIEGRKVYSVRAFNHDSSLVVTPGWDDVTGVGSPNNAYLTAQGG